MAAEIKSRQWGIDLCMQCGCLAQARLSARVLRWDSVSRVGFAGVEEGTAQNLFWLANEAAGGRYLRIDTQPGKAAGHQAPVYFALVLCRAGVQGLDVPDAGIDFDTGVWNRKAVQAVVAIETMTGRRVDDSESCRAVRGCVTPGVFDLSAGFDARGFRVAPHQCSAGQNQAADEIHGGTEQLHGLSGSTILQWRAGLSTAEARI